MVRNPHCGARNPFRPLFAIPLIIAGVLFLQCGCQKPKAVEETKPAATLANLQTAFARAVRHQRMYTLFAQKGDKEHNPGTARLFRAIARSEEIRAANHATLLRSRGVEPALPQEESVVVGTVEQTLKRALNSEDIQRYDMYPHLIAAAEAERDTAAVAQFTLAKNIDQVHRELLFNALNNPDETAKLKLTLCPGCGNLVTSGTDGACPVCKLKKMTI